jgi:ATP-binding cassette subfamily B protein
MSERFGVYRRLAGYLQPYSQQIALAYGSMLFAIALNLTVPQVIKGAIDNGLAAGDATALLRAAGLILGIAVLRGVMGFAQRFYGEWLSNRVGYDLRNHFYQSVQNLPFAFHDKARIGDLMSRATGDIAETERFTGIGLMDLLATLLLLIGVTVAMLLEDASLAVWVLGPLVVLMVAALRFGTTIRPMFKKIQAQMGVLSSVMQESLTGIGVVKAFAREQHEFAKFDRDNEKWSEMRYKAVHLWADYWPLFTLVLSASTLLLLWFGGPRAIAGEVTVGTLFVMISYVLMLNAPVLHMGFVVNLAATAGASASRIFEIIDTPNEIEEAAGARDLEHPYGAVRFEHVSFTYGQGRSVLRDVSFDAQPGQMVALIGPTGSGKSTITNLIPRFYDPTEGRILVDGVDIRELKLKSLRSHIGIVLQEPFLFDGTVAENIAYGRPEALQEEIVAAARAAKADDFIRSFPEGYGTKVGERGVTLSGGQKQRIAIARALLYDPRILILDDSTSSVDTETEHIIQQALAILMQGRTTFVIAQRLLTLKSANQILVLEQGRIIERGAHDELLKLGGHYRKIYDLQLRDQEEFLALEAQQKPRKAVEMAAA